ncbi:hypothetical protein M8C21_009282, partial [Ambrosia artemisiifolia]
LLSCRQTDWWSIQSPPSTKSEEIGVVLRSLQQTKTPARSEWSLGIITKVSILTPPKLSLANITFLACQDYIRCQKLPFQTYRRLGEILSTRCPEYTAILSALL